MNGVRNWLKNVYIFWTMNGACEIDSKCSNALYGDKKVCLCLCKNKPWLDENLNFNAFRNKNKFNKKVSLSTESVTYGLRLLTLFGMGFFMYAKRMGG